MYEAYWRLAEKPFENTSDPRYFYPGESHQGALLKLRYALESRRGAALLTGGVGLGKTLLVQTLARQLPDTHRPLAQVVFPQMPPDQLLAYVADELTGERTSGAAPVGASIARLQRFLAATAAAGRHAVLVVDEAHLLATTGALDTLRLLLNLPPVDPPAWSLLLCGQPGLLAAVARLPELEERFSVKCLLRPLSEHDTAEYVRFRLRAAGAEHEIFEPAALATLHWLSRGSARQINRLADLALLVGFAEERSRIDAPQIEAVAEELLAVTPD